MSEINRSLSDPALDDVDHALGRPRNPLVESYRNHYCAPADTDLTAAMRTSPWWAEGATINGGADVYFHVTPAGRRALAEHLAEGRA